MHPTPSFCSAPICLPSKSFSVAKDSSSTTPSRESTCEKVDDNDLEVLQTILPQWRKNLVVFVSTWIVMAGLIFSTALFAVTPEIVDTFGVSTSLVTMMNSLVFVSMAVGTLMWGPLVRIIGRRTTFNAAIFVLILCSIGSAVAPNFATLVTMRVLGGLEITVFNIVGQIMIENVFISTQRKKAVGFFMAGTAVSPALGPLIGGIIVTYSSWRLIFWVQTAITTVGLILSLLVIPSIECPVSYNQEEPLQSLSTMHMFNPLPTLRTLLCPNVLLVNISCGFIAWTQYSILAAPRHLSLFSLASSPKSGTEKLGTSLFYLAPGAGFLLGSLLGGYWSERVARKNHVERGIRLPQDTLESGLAGFLLIVPVSLLIFGWFLQADAGGIALAIVTIFTASFGLMIAFSSCRSYAEETLPSQRIEVMGGKYLVQYLFSAAGSASTVTLISENGIGAASSIGVVLVFIAGILVVIVSRWGLEMQAWWTRGLKQTEA